MTVIHLCGSDVLSIIDILLASLCVTAKPKRVWKLARNCTVGSNRFSQVCKRNTVLCQ